MKKRFAAVALLLAPSFAHADGVAYGVDMWSRAFEQWGLFTPHVNDCDSSTEVFIQVAGTNSRGFCMDKNERAALKWTAARDDCAADQKRLPEPAEFQVACDNPPAGLTNMTDALEWVGNFPMVHSGSVSGDGTVASTAGNGSCGMGSWGSVAMNSGSPSTNEYRCVR